MSRGLHGALPSGIFVECSTRRDPRQRTINNAPADFSPDGTKLLFVSDSGREFASLRSYDLATGAKRTVYEQNWDVLGGDYSKGGKYLTVYVNEDSRASALLDTYLKGRRVAERESSRNR